MVLHRNEAFPQPDDNAKIWRYLPFIHFKETILNGTLWFGNAFDYDHDEGLLTDRERVIRRSVQIEYDITLNKPISKPSKAIEESDNMKKDTFIICWTEGDIEIQRMWEDKTGDRPREVAIQSSFWRLKQVLDQNKQYGFWTAKIKYIDHSTHLSVPSNVMLYYARKNKSKAYENEIRAMTTFFGIKGEGQSYQKGLQIPADLDFLIEGVRLSPYAPSLLSDVKDLLEAKGLRKPVQRSLI